METINKAQDRLEVLKKIEDYERQGLFDLDVENDPPSKTLMPNDVDYLNKKLSSKIKTRLATHFGRKFFESMLKNKQVIYAGCSGLENLKDFKGGAIITCNHFNPFDNYALYLALENRFKKFTLHKIVREGNYSLTGKLGFLMRNGNTLPLSTNIKTMANMLKAVNTLLVSGEKILVYPEQGMWWNYKKPRPLKEGAYKFAIKANVPVIPCFITLKDSNIIGSDGFYVQEYFVHILPLIYPDESLPLKERTEKMKNQNFDLYKSCYEETYGIKLEYTTK